MCFISYEFSFDQKRSDIKLTGCRNPLEKQCNKVLGIGEFLFNFDRELHKPDNRVKGDIIESLLDIFFQYLLNIGQFFINGQTSLLLLPSGIDLDLIQELIKVTFLDQGHSNVYNNYIRSCIFLL